MSDLICECGNTIPQRRNSTIQEKKCPKCKYAEVMEKGKKKKTGKGSGDKKGKMKYADEQFSKYIRLLYSFPALGNKNERLCKCYTCGTVKTLKVIHSGHYHGRGRMNLRYVLRNARPQCYRCNYFLQGAHTTFRQNLINEIGAEEVADMDKTAYQDHIKADIEFFRQMGGKYKQLVNELIKELGIEDPWKRKPKTK